MTKQSAEQFANDSIWDNWYRTYQDGSLVPGVRYPNEHLVRFMADWRRSAAWPTDRRPRVLEFGFGTVTNMAMTARFGCDVEGLEVSGDSTERTREAIAGFGMQDRISVETYEGGALVPKPDARYDCLVGLQCVYYNLDQATFAAECARLLRPGGLLFLSFFSHRHGYMQHINGTPGGPVRFKDDHPNPRLVGLNPFLYRDEAQFEETYGKHFEIKVGLDEFDLLPVFQSWYYLRGQKRDAEPARRLVFPLSVPEAAQAPALAEDPANARELLAETVDIWSAYTAAIPDEEPFPGEKYPNEQIVRFLATWRRRERGDYFVASIGNEDEDATVRGMKALEINPLNPVHLEAMQAFGYEPHCVGYAPRTLEVVTKGLDSMGLAGGAVVDAWDGVTLPYADATFSAVVSAKAAYYQPNQREFAAETARVVRPGGEIFLCYLSPRHGYCRWLEPVSGNVFRFTAEHPNKALVGASVVLASPEALTELWSPYFEMRVGNFEFSTYKVFSSFNVVTGRRR